MILAEASPLLEWGLLGTIILCTGIVVSRAFTRNNGQAARQSGQDDDETDQVETKAARRVANLEVRLHDFAREVEARLEKRALELDALVAAADREIIRLTDLLKNSSPAADLRHSDMTRHSTPEVSAAQEQMICNLHGAGFSVPEIAHMVGHPADAVKSILRAA